MKPVKLSRLIFSVKLVPLVLNILKIALLAAVPPEVVKLVVLMSDKVPLVMFSLVKFTKVVRLNML